MTIKTRKSTIGGVVSGRSAPHGDNWAFRIAGIALAVTLIVPRLAHADDGESYTLQKSVAYNIAAHATATEINAACKSKTVDEKLAELQEGFSTENDTHAVNEYVINAEFRNRMIETALAGANGASNGKAWRGYITGIGAGISLARDDNTFAELVGLYYTKTMAEFFDYTERQQMCKAAKKTATETELAMQKLFESGDYSLVYVIFNLPEAAKKSP